MIARTDTCWADPLTRRERVELARMLARHCKRFWDAAATSRVNSRAANVRDGGNLGNQLVAMSAECSDLHLDVTERAAVPPR